MKFTITALIAFAVGAVSAGCVNDGGNWYCNPTKKVIFQNVGFSGSYQDVTFMDDTTGQCTQQTKSFSGNLSPLDEELSVHFRGPIELVQFGVYYPGSNTKREEEEEDCETTQHHKHHKHKRATQIVAVTQTVIVDGNGNTVTTAVAQTIAAPPAAASPNAAADEAASFGVKHAYRLGLSTSSLPTTTLGGASSVSIPSNVPAGSWVRSSYYTPGTGDNVVFLNNHGGSGSGVWSGTFGNSLSFANGDCSNAASAPTILDKVTLKSNQEFVIFSGNKCASGDANCGYYRPGTPAYHGFGGANKIFVFEFSMPSDGSGGFNGDMPAVWLLNAKIPRTLQYGKIECSCWATGCGELDLFEILSSGSTKLISTLHSGQGANGGAGGGGGSSDYFVRPTSGTFKGAAIFTDKLIHVVQLDDSTKFDSTLDANTIASWIAIPGSQAVLQG